MTDDPTARLQALRGKHYRMHSPHQSRAYCGGCEQPWPCDAARLGDVAIASIGVRETARAHEAYTKWDYDKYHRDDCEAYDAALAAVEEGRG